MHKKITSIHDKVFKSSLTDIRVARDFLEQHLPCKIQAAIDFDTLSITKESYITKELEAFYSDLVYKINLKDKAQTAYIYLLIEHQSSIDALMPFRLLNYCVRIWEKHLKQHQTNILPLIFPLVFYHGEATYTGPRKITDLIQAPLDLAESVLLGPFHLVDMHTVSDIELRKRKWAGILQFMLKHIKNRNTHQLVDTIIELLKNIDGELGVDVYASSLLLYWFNESDACKDPEEFLKAVAEGLSTRIGGEVMTMAQRWKQQHEEIGIQKGREETMTMAQRWKQEHEEIGIQKGMQMAQQWAQEHEEIGMQKGTAHLLRNLLRAKFNDLPDTYIKKIDTADENMLNKWAINCLHAHSLEEIFNHTEVVKV